MAMGLIAWVMLLGCAVSSPVDDSRGGPDTTAIRTSAELDGKEGQTVTLVGTYRLVDMRMRPTPPAQYRGHAAIEVADGTLIFLEPTWSHQAIRPESEQEFEGQWVAAQGTFYRAPPPPPQPMAALLGACLCPVTSVRAVSLSEQ